MAKMTLEQFRQRVKGIESAFPKAVMGGMRAGMKMAQRISKREFIRDRSGPPLPPPGPLTNRSGNLRSTIRVQEPRQSGRTFTAALLAGGSGVRYARIHEKGGGRIPARPYLRPALEKARPQIEKQIAVALDTLFKRQFR